MRMEFNIVTGETKEIPEYKDDIIKKQNEVVEQQRLYEASLTYVDKRIREYPSIQEQLDLLYHGGYDAWKAKITEIKNKYPKV